MTDEQSPDWYVEENLRKVYYADGYLGWVIDLKDGTCRFANDPLLGKDGPEWGDRVKLIEPLIEDELARVDYSEIIKKAEEDEPDDDPLTYTWEQRSGPNVALDNANSAQASFVPVEDGFYEFALTVTDGRGGSDTSVVRVFVGDVDSETCPRAAAGTDRTASEGAAVRLRGGNSADASGQSVG